MPCPVILRSPYSLYPSAPLWKVRIQPRSSKYCTIAINSSNPSRLLTSMPKHKRDIRFTDVGRWAAMGQIVDRRQEFAALPSYLAKLLAHSTRPTAYYNTNPFSTPLNPIERLRLESRAAGFLYSLFSDVFLGFPNKLAAVLRTVLERVFSKIGQP